MPSGGLPNYSLSDCQRDAANAAAQYGLPANLLFSLAVQESGCGKHIYGSSGEIGVTQTLPGTFSQFGCSGSIYNPVDDFKCSAKILSTYYNRNHSYALDLAAYNAGSGNVQMCSDGTYGVPRSSTVTYILSILSRAGLPVDKVVKKGCSTGAQPGQPSGGQTGNTPAPTGGPNVGDISGTLELPNVRGILIYGLALVLIIFAVTRLK